jgi:CrcB protein
MSMWLPYILVGVGGFVGANARFVLARGVGALFETRFPLGTFIVNMSGSFLLGVLGTIIALKVTPNSESMRRLALGVGFLGAFTTFSTFEFETHALFEDGSWLMVAAQPIERLPRRLGAASLHVGQPPLNSLDRLHAIEERLVGLRILDHELRLPVDSQDQGVAGLPKAVK